MRLTRIALTTLALSCHCWAQQAFPAPDTSVNTQRPPIGFDFQQPARNPQLIIDGHEFTGQSQISGTRIQWTPNYDIEVGVHTVQARALNFLGLPIGANWKFTVAPQAPPPPPPNQGANPSNTKIFPAQDAVVGEVRPRISVNYPDTLRSAKMWVDGVEQTSQVNLNGANVVLVPSQDLAAGRHQVASQVTFLSGQSYSHNWSFEVKPAAAAPTGPAFYNFSPAGGTHVTTQQPFISVEVAPELRRPKLMIDGRDFTSQCEREGNRIGWNPGYKLDLGTHKARVEARNAAGQVTGADWNFIIDGAVAPPPPPPPTAPPTQATLTVDEPLTGDTVEKVFDVNGSGAPGAIVKISVRPLPKKNKVVQFKGTVDRAGYYTIPVSASWAGRGQRLEVIVNMIDAQTGKKLAPTTTLEVYRQ